MNLNQLRFASAVASKKSFSQAAGLCHVTQPTLSNGIALLEKELGGKLFERTTRRVVITPFGRHLLPLIDQALAATADLRAAAKDLLEPDLKILRIGMSPLVDMDRLGQILAPYQKANPEVEFFFKQCFLDDLEERLQAEQIDVGLWPEPEPEQHPRMHNLPIYQEALHVLVSAQSVLSETPRFGLTVKDLKDETFVLTPDICGLARATQKLFRQARIRPAEYPGQALSYDVMQEWADLGVGSAVLPASKLIANNVNRARALLSGKGQPVRLTIVASWNKTANTSPHVAAFRQHLKDVVPRLMAGQAA